MIFLEIEEGKCVGVVLCSLRSAAGRLTARSRDPGERLLTIAIEFKS